MAQDPRAPSAARRRRRGLRLSRRARIAARQGRDEFAIACLQRALSLTPTDATARRLQCLVPLGDLYARTDRHAGALDAYLQALRLAPRDIDVHLALAQALSTQRLFDEALSVLGRALRIDPDRPAVHVALAEVHHARGTLDAAREHYERALRVDPDERQAQRGLARLQADVLLRRGGDGDVDEAVRLLRGTLNAQPRDERALRLLVDALQRLDRVDDLVGAWVALGATMEAADPEGAARAYEAAVALKPDCLRAWMKLADARLALGQPDEATRCLEAAVAIDPEQPAAHVNLGWARRMRGDFVGGWTESAWQYRAGDKRRFEQPAWDGAPLGRRTLLLWADFALGDTIQDLRFVERVRHAHPEARLLLECDRRLVSLAASVPVDEVIAYKAPLPAFDLQLPLRRLPELFSIDVDTIPARVPYVSVDAARIAHWRQRLAAQQQRSGKAMTVGIVWAGEQTRLDARTKSASLATFAPLAPFAAAGVRFVSLQLGPTVDELIAAPRGLRVARLLDDRCDVADTGALMHALDLVLTVDTMTAHLAGALARPVWVLAAHAPAWWLWHLAPSTDRSRWYPTMRLFRQSRAGDWDGVMQRVCDALRVVLGDAC